MSTLNIMAVLLSVGAFASVILLASRLGSQAQELERRLRTFKIEFDRREEALRHGLNRLSADRADLAKVTEECRLALADLKQESKEMKDRLAKVEQAAQQRQAPVRPVRLTAQERADTPFHKKLGVSAA